VFYEPAELGTIVSRAARVLGIELRPDGAAEIAQRSRGTPRVAIRLLRRIRDFAAVNGVSSVDAPAADGALQRLDVDARGLDAAADRGRIVGGEGEEFGHRLLVGLRIGGEAQRVEQGPCQLGPVEGGHPAAELAGDDTGDRAAFAALTRRQADEPGFAGLRIAVRSGEAPPGLLDDADVVVDGPVGLADLLGDLAVSVRPPG